MALTDAEKVLLRAGGHKTTCYLSILAPDSILVARLNNVSIARGDRSIAYDGGSGTAGEYARITAGQTLWVGSSAGDNDKGAVRVKSITGDETSGTITIAENAISWADNDFLTLLEEYPFRPIFPRIDADGVFYKDYNVEYTDENLEPPPVAIAGPHRAGFLSGGTLRFYLDATESYVIASGAALSSYAWACTGGSIDNAAVSQTFIDFATEGTYWLKLTVTDDNGKSQSTYRVLFVHNSTIGDVDYPHSDFEITTFNGSWDRGGWDVNLLLRDAATTTTIPDGTLIVIWQEVTYGTISQDIGGWVLNDADARNILFAGYVRGDTITRDWATGEVSFQASTVNSVMKNTPMFALSLDHDNSPSTWYQMAHLTVPRALYHYWRYHSTLFEITDVYLPVKNTWGLKYCRDLIMGNLFTVAKNFSYHNSINAIVCCNKMGQMHVERDVNYLNTAGRAALPRGTKDITTADRRAKPDLTLVRKHEKSLSAVQLSGFSFDGSTESPLISIAPGIVPEHRGAGRAAIGRQVLASQTDCNERSGRVLAIANNEYPEARVQFAGNYLGVLDMVPSEWWTLTVAAGDTERGVEFTDKLLVPRVINAQYDAAHGVLLADSVFDLEAIGDDGITSSYPTIPPTTNPEPGTPTEPGPPPAPGTPTGLGTVYVATGTHIGRTPDFDKAGGASWTGLTGALTGTIYEWLLDPWNPRDGAYVFTYDSGNKGGTGIWYCSNLSSASPTFTLKYTVTQIETAIGGSMTTWLKMVASINEDGYVGFSCSKNNGVYYLHTHDRWTTVTSVHVHSSSIDTSYSGRGMDLVPHLVGGNIWVYVCYKGGFGVCVGANGRVEISKDGGHTFSVCGVGCINDATDQTRSFWGPLTCPYDGNEDGQTFYMVTRPSDRENHGTVYKSTDGGNSVSAHKPGTAGPALFHRISIESHTHDKNRVFLWDAANKLWVSNNAMGSWSEVGDGDTDFGFAGDVSASGGFPDNNNLFYALAGGIYYSTDRGATWKDATGDWVSAIGAFGTGKAIVPMWLE